jgi:LmbE family N-acetylglucosaminyl deacetylase
MILAFAPHPDDLEFGCGPILFQESARSIPVHCILTSYGEAASNGTPKIREQEAQAAAKILGTTLEFAPLTTDAHLHPSPQHAIAIAAHIRTHKPQILLAPTPCENQHPDHTALAKIVRDAARLARYAGLPELKRLPPHATPALLFYAITPDAEPRDTLPLLIDISAPETLAAWTAAMTAHASQMKTKNYLDLQLTRARLHGLRASTSHALPLYPNDPLLLPNLNAITKTARAF